MSASWLSGSGRGSERHPLLTIFAALTGSHVGGLALGLFFWMIAAHTLTPHQVGVGAALIAATTLLQTLGQLGIGTLMLERFKFLAGGECRALFSTGLTAAVIGSVVVAAVWAALSSLIELPGALGDLSPSAFLLVVIAAGVFAARTTFDQAMIAMGASSVQLRRNLLEAGLRIAAFGGLIALGFRDGKIILLCWIVSSAASLGVYLLRVDLPARTWSGARQRLTLVRSYWTVALGHHGLSLALVSGGLLLPVVVASMMPADQTAYFSQARMLADAGLALPYFLATALLTTSRDLDTFRRNAVRTFAMGMALVVALFAGALLIGRHLLMLFGPQYAQESLPLLLLLLASGPILVVKDHFSVLRRLQNRRAAGAVAMASWTVVELSGAVAGSMVGDVHTLCMGWLAASGGCALVALPALLKVMRKPREARPAPAVNSRLGVFHHG